MNALVRKEVRMLLPMWAGAMMLVLGAICLSPTRMVGPLLASSFAVGSILLALVPFGLECSWGTFSNLLSQPVARARIWRVKTRVLGVGLGLVFALFLAGIPLREAGAMGRPSASGLAVFGGMTVVAAASGGLWTTLLFRQMAAAFWFTLLLPFFILMMASGVLDRLSEPAASSVAVGILLVYSIAGFWFARHQFLRAQDTQWTGGTIALPRLRWWDDSGRARTHRRRPLLALLGKELQLHQSAYVVAGVLLAVHLIVLVVRVLSDEALERNSVARMFTELWWVLWLALPLLVAASSMAEERQLNTQQAQLCLPVRRWTLTTVKFGVVLLLGLFFGALVPALLESVGARWGAVNQVLGSSRTDPGFGLLLGTMSLCSGWIVIVTLFASSHARHTLQALGLAMGIGAALTAGGIGVFLLERQATTHDMHWMPLIGWIGVPFLLFVLVGQAFRGAGRLHAGWSLAWRSLAAVASAILLTGLTTAAVHDRAWERVVRVEPRAGPPRLHGAVTPRIVYDDRRESFMVLLPDGRLWISTDYEERVAYERRDEGPGERRPAVLRVPRAGRFVGFSNWVAVAGTSDDLVGLQSDGTLWSVAPWDEPRQIGDESKWRSVAAGHRFFVALREDGTIWGWGRNDSGQLGRYPPPRWYEEPIRIGTDDDWKAVHVSGVVCTGIKRDGSVWRWGYLSHVQEGEPGPTLIRGATPEPIRWPWEGGDWRAIESIVWPQFHVILRKDGTLWIAGVVPPRFLNETPRRTRQRQWRLDPSRMGDPLPVGRHSDWTAIAFGEWTSFAGIRGGRLVFHPDFRRTPVPWQRTVWRPSRRSDWLAVRPVGYEALVALGADGTLAFWGYPDRPRAGFAGLLAPSRKPWWTVNVAVPDSRTR